MAAGATYDYVIVGAGSAGCVLAARLSEDPDVTVLLLEAGGWNRDPWIHIPLGWGRILQRRSHDWGYFSGPEPHADGRMVECARGRVVGGSSSPNAMAHVRGHPADYDRWAAAGLDGWASADVLPYFRRLESWEDGADAWRGGDGPLTVQRCRYRDPLVEAVAEAAQVGGYGWRCSAAVGYLRPALARRSLRVEVAALARRVVLEGGRAAGIDYVQGGRARHARASREVILAGGAINSPQLLMLSGIGPPEVLRREGVACRVPLDGVGRNLQDHASVILMYRRKEPGPFHRAMRADRIARELGRAYLFGTGLAADVPGGVTAFLRTDPASPVPDTQILFTAAPLAARPYLAPFRPPFADGFATRVVMLHPESRGSVEPAGGAPAIRQNFLATEADRKRLRAGFRLGREIAAQGPLGRFIAAETAPGAVVASDAEIDAFVRATAITVHHPLGTCRMGPQDDEEAVVGPDLRVLGVEALRVVDGSVLPDLPSGNINAPIVMVAEKAADLIRGRPPPAKTAAEKHAIPRRP